MKSLLVCVAIVLAVASGAANAQTPSSSSSSPPAAASGQSATNKQAISKACSDQANAKGLHGKARKKFRSECRRAGGKPM